MVPSQVELGLVGVDARDGLPRPTTVPNAPRRDGMEVGVPPADAAQGGARAVRQEVLLGSLEVGKKADLIVLDILRAHLIPAGRILSAWINSGQPSYLTRNVRTTEIPERDR